MSHARREPRAAAIVVPPRGGRSKPRDDDLLDDSCPILTICHPRSPRLPVSPLLSLPSAIPLPPPPPPLIRGCARGVASLCNPLSPRE